MDGNQVHLDLDGAFAPDFLDLRTVDARAWGPQLRCFAPKAAMDAFAAEVARKLPPFVLYGSGDFHHLAAVFVRNIAANELNIISFDNHPDWDVRPPHWACGGWINRVLELPQVRRVSIWGCGNFELRWPARMFGSRDPRIDIHPWAERYPSRDIAGRFAVVDRSSWRGAFAEFVETIAAGNVYVTVDLDCLAADQVASNWENGLFTADDVAWAIGQIRNGAHLTGGDVCGAWSKPAYARRRQRFAANWDHPGATTHADRSTTLASVRTIWRALTG